MSQVELYKLCDGCNKEIKLHTGPALLEGEISAMEDCPHCGETNHVWIRFVITAASDRRPSVVEHDSDDWVEPN